MMKVTYDWPDDLSGRINRAIEALKREEHRAIIRMRFFDGLSLPEIAQRMGRKLAWVRKQYRSVLRKLEREMEDVTGPVRGAPVGSEGEDLPPVELEERIEKVAELYWEAIHKGESPDSEAFVEQYPELREFLRPRLALIELMYEDRPAYRSGPPFPLHSSLTPHGFRNLFRKALKGDRQSMDEILSALSYDLERLARPYEDPAGHYETSTSGSDVLREACLHAWKNLGSFEESGSDEETFAMFRSWLGQIIKGLGINARRDRERRRRSRSTSESGPMGSAHWKIRRTQDALERLSDRVDAAILWLHLYDGLAFRQISERTQVDYKRVRERYRRAIRLLQLDLKDLL